MEAPFGRNKYPVNLWYKLRETNELCSRSAQMNRHPVRTTRGVTYNAVFVVIYEAVTRHQGNNMKCINDIFYIRCLTKLYSYDIIFLVNLLTFTGGELE